MQPAATAFIMLLVTVGPVEVAAMFLVLTLNLPTALRRRLAIRAILVGTTVLFLFALGGNWLLAMLQVGLPAFRTAGGVLLLGLARDLLFAQHSGLSSITPGEEREAAGHADIAVFPLAIPLIAGPGSIAAVVLLMGQARTGFGAATVLGALALVMALTLAAMLGAAGLVRLLSRTGVNVVARISGILLAALAMQFVFDGLRDSGLVR